MKKSNDFLSFIDSMKSEIQKLKKEIGSMEDFVDPNSNVLRASSKPKSKQKSSENKIPKSQSYEVGIISESSEGKSLMNESMEGVSIEGRSMMTESFEGKTQMTTSMEGDRRVQNKNEDIFNTIKNKKNDRLGFKDKENLKRLIIFSEVFKKPKSLK